MSILKLFQRGVFALKILNVGYRSVNCYLLNTEKVKLLIDVGWPGGMRELKWSIASEGYSIKEVTHVLVTHYHMDHGAITQEMKEKGAKLIAMESQIAHLNEQGKFIKPPMIFHEIKNDGNIVLAFSESRSYLRGLDVNGEIIPTPGHSIDHVTVVLDEGAAFTGDLPPENCSSEGSDVFKDWQRLQSMKVTKIFPAHGRPYAVGSSL